MNTVNQINAKKRALLAKFEKDQKEKRLKWFENVGAGDFSVLEEMIISKNANINWIDDKVNVGGSEVECNNVGKRLWLFENLLKLFEICFGRICFLLMRFRNIHSYF